jgi:hypothetical protein
MSDLLDVLKRQGHAINLPIMTQIIRGAGYRWRKAKVVLTSNDKRFREKVDRVREILSRLRPDEAFFSIDEFGPFAIRLRGGRALVAPSDLHVIPQWQKSKGFLIVVAALELSSNQIVHCYARKKNTAEIIRLIAIILRYYSDRKRIFLSWDAASWHRSRQLFDYIAKHNSEAGVRQTPLVEVAPLPARSQFLNVIESVFSGMARAIIHNSDYPSVDAARTAMDRYFAERNEHFQSSPRPPGRKIWGKERIPSAFGAGNNCKDPRYS